MVDLGWRSKTLVEDEECRRGWAPVEAPRTPRGPIARLAHSKYYAPFYLVRPEVHRNPRQSAPFSSSASRETGLVRFFTFLGFFGGEPLSSSLSSSTMGSTRRLLPSAFYIPKNNTHTRLMSFPSSSSSISISSSFLTGLVIASVSEFNAVGLGDCGVCGEGAKESVGPPLLAAVVDFRPRRLLVVSRALTAWVVRWADSLRLRRGGRSSVAALKRSPLNGAASLVNDDVGVVARVGFVSRGTGFWSMSELAAGDESR